MMKTPAVLLLLLTLCAAEVLHAQPQKYTYTYTLEEVLALAKEQSPEAVRVKNTFEANYWQYRSYRASRLPSLNLSGTAPGFSRQLLEVQRTDTAGNVVRDFSSDFSNRLSGTLRLVQNLPTGGVLSVYSSLERLDRFRNNFSTHVSAEYLAAPVSLSLSQSLFGVNQWKWRKKIEPLRYEEAKRSYLKQLEAISIQAIRYFFDLAGAQQNLSIASFNQANNDTLHKIAIGRYHLGTIGENDLLQSELNYLSAGSALNEAQLSVEMAQNRLRSFLGYNELVTVSILIPENVPQTSLDLEHVMQWARKNNPDLLAYQRQLIEAEQRVAEEKAATGVSADINLSFGLNQQAGTMAEVYKDPRDMQTVSISLQVPLLDWGLGRGRVRMAKSNRQIVQTQVEQALADFEQDVVLKVRQFNMQDVQFRIAAKSDTIAQKRYEVSKARFLIDKITVTDMNNAQIDRDRSQQNYVSALHDYWNFYYLLRQLALYDFIRDEPLETDFELLVE